MQKRRFFDVLTPVNVDLTSKNIDVSAPLTPMAPMVLRQIGNKYQGRPDDVLIKSNSRLNWDQIKQFLITHFADKRTEPDLLRKLNQLENKMLSVEAFYDEILDTYMALFNINDSGD